jgi:hypothetical protein
MYKHLQGKKVLLISPVYFNYYKEMIKSLTAMGAEVDWFDERPSNGFFVKAILRVNENLIMHNLNKYYSNIIENIKHKTYDYILIIKPEGIPVEVIEKLKKLNPKAKVVIELWDSLANNKAAVEKLQHAHKVFSFDKDDCKKYNLIFRPLFYIDKYKNLSKKANNNQYDLLFIGTVHTDRYKVLVNLKNKLEAAGLKVYFYMYIPYKAMYIGKKVLLRKFSGSSIKDFKFKPLSQDQIVDLVGKSRVVLDIQHPKQTGLTMRTIEMLGANKKLITTNESVKDYDFYNKANIQVVDRNISNLDLEFFNSKYEVVPNEIKEKYSLEYWLLELLS